MRIKAFDEREQNELCDQSRTAGCPVASELLHCGVIHHDDGRGLLPATINSNYSAPAANAVSLSCIFSPDKSTTTDNSVSPNKSFASSHSISNTKFTCTYA